MVNQLLFRITGRAATVFRHEGLDQTGVVLASRFSLSARRGVPPERPDIPSFSNSRPQLQRISQAHALPVDILKF